ncbi:hypothetical protein FDECE_3382, partial [Fusarium decemcellulare]
MQLRTAETTRTTSQRLKPPPLALSVTVVRATCAKNISDVINLLMTENHTSAISVASCIGAKMFSDVTWLLMKIILQLDRALVTLVMQTRLNETAQTVTPVIIAEASGVSSTTSADSHIPRNAPSPSPPHVDATAEPQSPDDAAHLKMILQELSTSPPRSSPLCHTDFPNAMDKWLLDCLGSYVDHFHYRWHIITAPTYEFEKKPYDNVASVLMIGSYYSYATEKTR